VDALKRSHTLVAVDEVGRRMRVLAPTLLAVPGCGVLGAAAIIGETAGARRFKSRDAFARFTGTAPIPVWSGDSRGKVRLNRGGNRRINCALHMIAITQARGIGRGSDYIAQVQARGKTRTEALRLLRRQLSNTVFTALLADEQRGAEPRSHLLQQAARHRSILDTRTGAQPRGGVAHRRNW
jgi:transposase